MINIAKPSIGDEEKQAVQKVLDSGMIANGAVVTEFERKFADYIGAKYGIATNSGTTALEVAIRSLGLGKGDKILTTPFSFIASTNAIVYTGATPVFADIDSNTFNIDPDCIEDKLNEHPDIKALLIVHLFGQPCHMDRIMDIVKKHNLLLIEDCAQAHGALWKDQKVGSFGDASAFSFYPTKNMTTSEGGMVITNSPEVEKKARLLINHGMEIRYYHDVVGYNHRMTNISAAIGICQLSKLDNFNLARNKNAQYYNENIKNEYVLGPLKHESVYHVYHQYTLRIKNNRRADLIKHLEKNEVGFGIFYPISIPEQKCYEDMGFDSKWKFTDQVKNQVLSIPVHPLLTDTEVKKVVEVINDFR
ncbi:DegT/DnrJ/EryC1/StrS family aminotransferase [Paenibacillus tyrfis]|uniref:DegT/DnrJ/EryC1/StrS family aminotransferase n=1 Tax=Paenibacillus tyrfis TaxID=1501230 RepID=UPI00209D476A|nr:DegT/DnrJ/EryC1/StrS family aminotransferase [Paenibacillus tyrfis]MCP1309713.1 DegT/DnrJ/EryC1/StrS family aminotransferase [Paenibacillus tyrfis]